MAIAKQTTATVIPALQYQDAPAAIDFLSKAFGFEKKAVYEGEGGTIAHAELTLGNGMVMLGSVKESEYGKLLVSRFRSSHHCAAHAFANFGIKGTLAIYDSSAVFGFEVPTQTRGYNDRNFKSTALGNRTETIWRRVPRFA